MSHLGSFGPLEVGCPGCRRLGARAYGDPRWSSDAQYGMTRVQYCSSDEITIEGHPSAFAVRFLTAGSGDLELNGRHYALRADNYIISNSGSVYSFENAKGVATTDCAVSFSRHHLNDIARTEQSRGNSLREEPQGPVTFEFPEQLRQADQAIYPYLLRLVAATHNSSPTASSQLEELFYELGRRLLLEHGAIQTSLTRLGPMKRSTQLELYRRLTLAKDFMDASFLQETSLSEIAAVACLSPYHFLRAFKKFAGVTPYRYVLQLRMEHAKRLVTTSTTAFTAIARETGFPDLPTFSKYFKKFYGVTPTAMRAEYSNITAVNDH